MFRFRWILQLFTSSNCVPPSCLRKIAKPSVKPGLESLEDRDLLSANPISQVMASAPMAAISQTASNTTDASNGVSPLASGDVLALVQTIASEVRSDWNAFDARVQALADMLMSNLQGFGIGTLPAGLSQTGSGSGGGNGGNGVSSASLAATTAIQSSGSGSGVSALDGGPNSGSGNTDTLVWNPQGGSTDATDPNNWYDQNPNLQKNGVVAPGKLNPVIFDGTAGSKTSSNSPIDWKAGGQVASMKLQNGYNATMTVASDQTVEDFGSLTEDDSSTLHVFFGQGATFQVDTGGTITNMLLDGDSSGKFNLSGGTTTIAAKGGYSDQIGVNFFVLAGATLQDMGNSALVFANSKVGIAVAGQMQVEFGPNATNTLISNGGRSDDYINVTQGGFLEYLGSADATDTFSVPVLINGGTFGVTAAQGVPAGGTLIVTGTSTVTNGKSVYMQNSSEIWMSQQSTLVADNGYYQAGGDLDTTDATKCTLKVGTTGQGTADIPGGGVSIAVDASSPGELDITATTVNFGGTYHAAVVGGKGAEGPADLLKVNGNLNLSATTSVLNATVLGTAVQGDTWVILAANNALTNKFASNNDVQTGLSEALNMPKQGNYLLSKP